jgi:hypothetical protein
MPIDPMLLAVLEAFPMQFDDLGSMTAQEVRTLFEQGNPPPGEDVASVEDLEVPGPDGPLPVRVYRPDGAAVPAPVVVFFHGGGWNSGNPEQFFDHCEHLARQGLVGISAAYRLKNEHDEAEAWCCSSTQDSAQTLVSTFVCRTDPVDTLHESTHWGSVTSITPLIGRLPALAPSLVVWASYA